MSKNMCPRCNLVSMNTMKDVASAERKHWVRMEEELEMDIGKEEDRMEEEFAGLEGYEQEPD